MVHYAEIHFRNSMIMFFQNDLRRARLSSILLVTFVLGDIPYKNIHFMSQNKLLFCSLNSNLRIMYLQLFLQDLVLS